MEVKGDTMYLNGFTKMVIGGKEITDYPKIREKSVRENGNHIDIKNKDPGFGSGIFAQFVLVKKLY